jgi:hypothetical protein
LVGSDYTCSPESGNGDRILPDFQQQLHFSLYVIFSCEPNADKYFRENHFFLNDFLENILRQKLFYVETNGILIIFIAENDLSTVAITTGTIKDNGTNE